MVYLGIALVNSPGNIQLQASRRLSSFRSKEDAPNRMLITIENPGTPIHRVQLSETTRPKIDLVDGSLEQRFTIPSNEKVELHYTFNAPRGRYKWSKVRLTASDPFGLFEKTLELPAEAHTLVLPEPHKLDRIKFRLRPNIRAAGPNLSRLPGSGIDFWGVREYHPGNSLRAIHWRLAARHPRSFYSKEFEREEMADIGILLDARLAANPYHGADNLFEFSVQAAAALGKEFSLRGEPCLHAGAERPIGARLSRVRKTADWCASWINWQAATSGERVTFETLKYLPVRLFPSRSVIVIVSSLRSQDFDTIARLRAEGYQLLLVSPNPVQWAAINSSARDR